MKEQIVIDVPERYDATRVDAPSQVTIAFQKRESLKTNPLDLNRLPSGVYVIEGTAAYDPGAWGNRPADGILLATRDWFIAVDKNDMDPLNWEEARTKAKGRRLFGRACDLFDRFQALHVFDNLALIQEALKRIGGSPIQKKWYWTKDSQKDSPSCAFVVYMGGGDVTCGLKDYNYYVRAVSAFYR